MCAVFVVQGERVIAHTFKLDSTQADEMATHAVFLRQHGAKPASRGVASKETKPAIMFGFRKNSHQLTPHEGAGQLALYMQRERTSGPRAEPPICGSVLDGARVCGQCDRCEMCRGFRNCGKLWKTLKDRLPRECKLGEQRVQYHRCPRLGNSAWAAYTASTTDRYGTVYSNRGARPYSKRCYFVGSPQTLYSVPRYHGRSLRCQRWDR